MEWRAEVVVNVERLRGRTVRRWRGIEMALREEGADGVPQFEVEELPVVQLLVLELMLDDGPITIQTWQDGDEWALCTDRRTLVFSGGLSSSYRESELVGLPCELVSNVVVRLNDRKNVEEVLLAFENGAEVLLIAGEAYEHKDHSARFTRGDESVLLFRDPADAARLEWWR